MLNIHENAAVHWNRSSRLETMQLNGSAAGRRMDMTLDGVVDYCHVPRLDEMYA